MADTNVPAPPPPTTMPITGPNGQPGWTPIFTWGTGRRDPTDPFAMDFSGLNLPKKTVSVYQTSRGQFGSDPSYDIGGVGNKHSWTPSELSTRLTTGDWGVYGGQPPPGVLYGINGQNPTYQLPTTADVPKYSAPPRQTPSTWTPPPPPSRTMGALSPQQQAMQQFLSAHLRGNT